MKYTNFILTLIAVLLLILCFKLGSDRYELFAKNIEGLAVFDKTTGKLYVNDSIEHKVILFDFIKKSSK